MQIGSFARLALVTVILTGIAGCAPRAPQAHGQRPPAQAASAIRFHDVAPSAGLTYRWKRPHPGALNILETIGHGCAFIDTEGSGRLDILLVGDDHCLLYRNLGNGKFEDVTDRAFPGAPHRPRLMGCAVADYDGDGKPDIFVSGYGRTILYHNEGNGTFKDVTAGSGLEARGPYDWTTSAAWADTRGDGSLDLYVCRYVQFTGKGDLLCNDNTSREPLLNVCGPAHYNSEVGSLYRYAGHGHFRDVTREAGLDAVHGKSLGCMFCDFNNSGRPSVYIANDTQPGDLFENVGGGRFKRLEARSGIGLNTTGIAPAGMGVDWADYDGDGRFDLLVADWAYAPKSLYHNEGSDCFTQATFTSGLGMASMAPLTFGAAFVDADNDGWPDVAMTNGHVFSEIDSLHKGQTFAQTMQLLRNAAGRFANVTAEAGSDFTRAIVGRGLAIGDYDGDGRQDLLVVDDTGAPLLLHNDSTSGSHWIALRCVRGPHRTPAVGARVTLVSGGHTQIAEERASGTYLSTNAPGVHFGLGREARADSLTVRWSDGATSVFHSVAANHAYRVSPGDTVLREAYQ
jgi:hypothetical protein